MNETEIQTVNRTNGTVANISNEATNYLDPNFIHQVESLVDTLKDSTYAKQFYETSYNYDKDGNIIESSKVVTFNKSDMVMCLGLGASLGMNPFIALSYGKNLNMTSIKKITKGKQLGLDFATAMEQIYIWGEGSKEIVYTSIHITNTLLTKAGVKREIVKDGTIPYMKCTIIETGVYTDFDGNIHKDVPKSISGDTLDKVIASLKDKGLIPVYKDASPIYIAEMKLTRYNPKLRENESISIPYSSRDAINAGLYKGINDDGETVKGKANWNAHLATHLRKMSNILGGRIIASDILHGVYTDVELSMVKTNDDIEYTDIEEIQ